MHSAVGHIVNMKSESRRLKLEESDKVLIPLLEPLQKWLHDSSPEEPPVILNKHCSVCQFREQCQTKAIQEDSLSLLDRITPKVIRRYEKKGIFTVKQLSYLFKPRKRKKRVKNPSSITHSVELQALAIRTGKIYLQELPILSRQETELYLDIEGLPDQNFYYLIGLLLCQDNKVTYYSFWADETKNEGGIWQDFLNLITQYPDEPIYHYGSYEPRAIEILSKRYETNSSFLSDRLINVNQKIYGRVYFPIYSNRLKSIGNFVGATWTSCDASGLQSLAWRHYWDKTQREEYKLILLTYNKEDCQALKLLVDNLSKIQDAANILSEIDFGNQPKKHTTEAGEKIHNQFDSILKFASLKCEKNKISFRDISTEKVCEEKKQKTPSVKKGYQGQRKIRPKPFNVVEVIPGEYCPKCLDEPVKTTKEIAKRLIIDLALKRSGIKKTITEYVGIQGYCKKCNRVYSPPGIRQFGRSQMYGHGVKSWFVYHRVALRLPYEQAADAFCEQFNEEISWEYTPAFIKDLSQYYLVTEKSIEKHLLESPLLHADETPINIRGITYYVWVFTSKNHVIFRLTETRESTLARELLKNFKGVLVSDFYSGYDSINCRNQKCWVHLIRDLNNALRESFFDTEYESFVLNVRDLIVPIIEATDKHGLRSYNLKKFKKQVDEFYEKMITDKHYKSELTQKFQKRFKRYKDSLFTFLEYDGIPWHNNSAERAIRHLAKQRAISGSFHENVTYDYLRLLSIKQTCRFQGKSFFKFLFSGETDLDQFEVRKRKR
jgi:Transposase IS66 family/RNase_H superfamily